MTDKVWTRESLTAQILKDVAGLWRHIEAQREFARSGAELLSAVKGGCVALLQGAPMDTKDLMTLAVAMLHAVREITLEEVEKRGPSS